MPQLEAENSINTRLIVLVLLGSLTALSCFNKEKDARTKEYNDKRGRQIIALWSKPPGEMVALLSTKYQLDLDVTDHILLDYLEEYRKDTDILEVLQANQNVSSDSVLLQELFARGHPKKLAEVIMALSVKYSVEPKVVASLIYDYRQSEHSESE